MKEMVEYLNKEGYQEIEVLTDNNDNITHIYFEDRLLYYCLIAPHEGNDMHYLLRANAKANFDRWSIAGHQTYHNTIPQIIDMLEDSQIEVYENCLADLAMDYAAAADELEMLTDEYFNLKEEIRNRD